MVDTQHLNNEIYATDTRVTEPLIILQLTLELKLNERYVRGCTSSVDEQHKGVALNYIGNKK